MGGIVLSVGSGLFTSALVAFALAATPLLADAAAAALLIFFSGITFIIAGGALQLAAPQLARRTPPGI